MNAKQQPGRQLIRRVGSAETNTLIKFILYYLILFIAFRLIWQFVK